MKVYQRQEHVHYSRAGVRVSWFMVEANSAVSETEADKACSLEGVGAGIAWSVEGAGSVIAPGPWCGQLCTNELGVGPGSACSELEAGSGIALFVIEAYAALSGVEAGKACLVVVAGADTAWSEVEKGSGIT